jgi:quinol monooxygenase YgiN
MDVNSADRGAFLESRVKLMTVTRTEPGCIEYVFSPDPIDPSRVRLFELWESRADLDVHIQVLRANPPAAGDTPVASRSVAIYEIASNESLG